MGRESSHGTKELFNLPPLVLKARHLSGSADKPTELSCRVHFGLYTIHSARTKDIACQMNVYNLEYNL